MHIFGMEANTTYLLIGLVVSVLVMIFSRQIATGLFEPRPNGHPAANVFRIILYMLCWIFAPIAAAAVALFCAIGLLMGM